MADAVVSVVVEQIAALLTEQAKYHLNLVRGAEKEVAKLAKELNAVRNVLDDAEKRGYKEKSVKDWLWRLEQTSYEMEDVLDEWNYALRRFQIEGDRSDDAAPNNKVPSFIPSCLCCKKVVVRHGIAKKIIDVKEKLDEVLKEKDRYGFSKSQPITQSWRLPTTSFADLEAVRGRDSDKEILVGKLTGRRQELGIQLVSIVGLGGLGKTTLAQLVYNNRQVIDFFELRIWVCVSDPFDLAAIAKGILERVGGVSSSNATQLDVLLTKVQESVSGKRFLLVLDDVWTEDAKDWEPLKASLRCGGEGSKVLVTTRSERVAKAMGTSENDIHRPRQLSPDDCWSLLCHISLSGRREEERHKFQDIGKKIASKCNGLPLAVCVLGSLLQFKDSLEEWERVLESKIWELKEAEENLFPHLILSYDQLSPELKRCFSYCAVFPKDFRINVEKLIEYWIAQGYLGYHDGDMELKGQEYFQYLAMLSLFQDFERTNLYDEKITFCKMHDIVHDFAQSLRRDRGSATVEVGMKRSTCQRCRSSLVSSVKTYRSLVLYNDPYICDCLTSIRVLRTTHNYSMHGIPREMEHLIHLRWLDSSPNSFSSEDVKIICRLYNLQFLGLNNCGLKEVPSEIGNLTQLKKLDLSSNGSLKELPKEIGNLTQLKHFDLSSNDSLKELPKEIGNLTQLKHFDLCSNDSLKEVPKEIGNLTQLKHLDLSSNYSLKELPKEIGNLTQLKHLGLSFNGSLKELPKEIGNLTQLKHLDLSFNDSLKELPKEIGNLTQLKHLDLSFNDSLEELPKEIGNLTQLKHLNLSSNDSLKELPKEIGNLTQLKHLNLNSNRSLKELPKEIGNLTKLKHLNLNCNRSLKELPKEIGNLIQLKRLDLQSTRSLKELPESICGLINLEEIWIDEYTPMLLPEGVSKLTGLRRLSQFCGGRGWGKLGWLKNLNHLSFSLQLNIKMIDDSKDMIEDAREANLSNKIHLKKLGICFIEENDEMDEVVRMNVMDALEPHPNLQSLHIHMYKGSKLSGWVTSPLLQRLRSIRLSFFYRMPSLPHFGKLPCLEEFVMSDMEELQLVGREFLGITATGTSSNTTTVGFPKLKTLEFCRCGKWKEWEDITAEEEDSASVTLMPCLTELIIESCDCLTALPERLLGKKASSLEYVQITAVDPSASSLIKRYQDREGATWKPNRLHVPFMPRLAES